jgi:hypothetical protein
MTTLTREMVLEDIEAMRKAGIPVQSRLQAILALYETPTATSPNALENRGWIEEDDVLADLEQVQHKLSSTFQDLQKQRDNL